MFAIAHSMAASGKMRVKLPSQKVSLSHVCRRHNEQDQPIHLTQPRHPTP
jgi:hypothetical protein